MLPRLNFPQYDFRLRGAEKQEQEIFDRVRKKFVALTPEEWVRQHLLEFMMREKGFPASLLAVEKQLKLNSTFKRTDVLAYTSTLQPLLLAECKAPGVRLDVQVLTQIVRYNLVFNVPCLVITNGLDHFFFLRSREGAWEQGDEFLTYPQLLKSL